MVLNSNVTRSKVYVKYIRRKVLTHFTQCRLPHLSHNTGKNKIMDKALKAK